MTHLRIRAAIAAAALLTLGLATPAQAQMASSPDAWKGLHLGVSVGGAILRDGSNNTVVFDKNLDGTFTDTVLTAGGVNAFSPGFCTGSPTSNVPTAGCTQETKGLDFSGRLGYDWQMGHWVFGLATEYSMPDLSDSLTAFSTTPASYTFTREVDWLGTAGLRFGYAGDRWLLYATGGAAYAGLDQSFTTSNTVNTFVRTGDDKVWGYQAGGGIDFRVGSRVTLGAVYSYTSLKDNDKFTVRSQGPAPATNAFILTNAMGTDLQRADKMQWHSVRGVIGVRF
ncbi:MAG: outer membrane beta-barrel protein [Vicinamibacterales bacterium]